MCTCLQNRTRRLLWSAERENSKQGHAAQNNKNKKKEGEKERRDREERDREREIKREREGKEGESGDRLIKPTRQESMKRTVPSTKRLKTLCATGLMLCIGQLWHPEIHRDIISIKTTLVESIL